MPDSSLSKTGYDNEGAFIKKQEVERRTELNKQRQEQEAKEAQELHWMKCPKCGGQMEEVDFEKLKVDRCTSCEGLYFDKGEFELAFEHREEHDFFDKVKGFFKF